MTAFTVEEIRAAMEKTEYIRSVSVIAHEDHGMSTLTDVLFSRAGIISAHRVCDNCWMETPAEERERGVRISSFGVALCFERDDEEERRGPQRYLINLIDSSGHVHSSEVAAALRIADGALVVVDCVDGCAVQTETALRQALAERVKPCLFVNGVDRCLLELEMAPEDIYARFRKAVEAVNAIVAAYKDPLMGDVQVAAEKGNVGFGSALQGWGFTVERFAQIYAARFGVDKQRMSARLWGESFWNAKKRSWTSRRQPEGCEEPLPRAFCHFIMAPISQLLRAIVRGEREKYERMLGALGIALKGADRQLTGKALTRRAMQSWINAADTVLRMIVTKLPSPKTAQRYRVENLYEGPMDDEAATAIRACDPVGPLMIYVSKMVPSGDEGRFYAFGRVYSGTVATGQRVRIQGPLYRPGRKEHLYLKSVQRIVIMMGHYREHVADVPCGNIVGLMGIDRFILKSGTVTTVEDAHNIAGTKYSVLPGV